MSSTALKLAPRFSRDSLHAYQERAASFIKDTPSCALWMEMGLGKTAAVLTAIADLLDHFEAGRVLVIAPLRVVINTWPSEINRWDHTRHLTYRQIKGSPEQRLNILRRDRSDIHIINRELTSWLVKAVRSEPALRVGAVADGWPYDLVVIDEASSFKSPKTQRFKALRKMLPKIDRLIELTGTPVSNGLLDVWSQIFLLDRGARLGRTFTGFRDHYFIGDYHGYNWALRKDADRQIYTRLEDICLTLTAEDYLELPKRIDNVIDIDLPEKERGQYLLLERKFLAEIGDEIVEVLHAAALTNKLLQFANGAIYTGEEKNWAVIHDAKLTALSELVDEAAGRPLLVAYNYQTDVKRIRDKFPQAEIIGRTSDTIDRWNRGEIPMLLAHPASAGHGLNLQHGGNTIIWFGLNWSLELYQQFNARLHRQGQEKPVIIHHLAVRDSVDQTVLAALGRKDMTQRALLNALKEDAGRRAG